MDLAVLDKSSLGYLWQPVANTFGANLRELQRTTGVSATRLATELGVARSLISAWRRDKKVPALTNLLKIAACLKRPLDDLLVGLNEQYDALKSGPHVGAADAESRRLEREHDHRISEEIYAVTRSLAEIAAKLEARGKAGQTQEAQTGIRRRHRKVG